VQDRPRVWETSAHPRIYESKFATGEAQISLSLAQLLSSWAHWNEGERVQFAQAFAGKRTLTVEDEEVVEFLMQQSDERIAISIALLTTMHHFGWEIRVRQNSI